MRYVVGVLLILVGIGYALMILLAAGMSDSADASAEAVHQLWWALVPIGLGIVCMLRKTAAFLHALWW